LKKIMYLISIALMITLLGCGSGATAKTSSGKTLNLADVIKVYTNAGVTIDASKKPAFSVIGAKDGVLFYMDNAPVKIYEYGSPTELDKAEKDFSKLMKDWPVNGLFVLESSQDKGKDIFKGL